MVHTGFVERVLAQNKKRFRETRSIQLYVAVNLCHMNFLQMNFQNKIWLKVKIPGSNYRGFSVYSATTLANFFLPRLIMTLTLEIVESVFGRDISYLLICNGNTALLDISAAVSS